VRLKTDENMPSAVVHLLRDAGHDVETVVEERLGGAPDPAVIAACVREGRALVTLDKDFTDIRAYSPGDFTGIVVLRPYDQRAASIMRVVRRLLPHLDDGIDPLIGRLWIVDERGVRIRS
jgi:predicted nuclease of predicted toxin-antitoxin system